MQWLIIAGLLCGQPTPVVEADDEVEDRFDELLQRGLDAYEARDYEMAAEAFLEAYGIRSEPELVFNAARSHEKALQRDEAIREYERFLTLKGSTAALRARALESLNQIRREQAALNAPQTDPTAPAQVTASPPKPSVNRVPEILMLSLGGASLVTSLAFGIVAIDKNNQFEDSQGLERLDLRDDVSQYSALSDGFLVAGISLVVAGTVTWILRKPKATTNLSLAPTRGGGLAVGWAGRF